MLAECCFSICGFCVIYERCSQTIEEVGGLTLWPPPKLSPKETARKFPLRLLQALQYCSGGLFRHDSHTSLIFFFSSTRKSSRPSMALPQLTSFLGRPAIATTMRSFASVTTFGVLGKSDAALRGILGELTSHPSESVGSPAPRTTQA